MPIVADVYTDIQITQTAANIARMHEAQAVMGTKRINDFVFILDGKEYDLSFKELKRKLDADSRTGE